ncbi:MAG TPA: OPT family oligopeptide transporter [bacterium]|nr:OPT family oligopeptide transporter [bacterium]
MSEPEKKLTPEEEEQQWLETVYQGDKPQLTLRAIVTGSLLGGFMSLTNIYIGLKTGWGFGVAITAVILSFAIWNVLSKVFHTPNMTLLENNIMQSLASASGYTTGGTLVSAIAAYILVTGQHLNIWVLGFWILLIALLGTFMAIPLKRQMINVEKLPFPSGTASAETLKSLYSSGVESARNAKLLFATAGIGIANKLIGEDLLGLVRYEYFVFGQWAQKFTMSIESSLLLVGGGALMGWRTAWSILFGAILNYAVVAPWLAGQGIIAPGEDGMFTYRTIVGWSLWFGASVMVMAGLTAFAFQWRVIARTFVGMADIFRKQKRTLTAYEEIEVPGSWFAAGMALTSAGIVIIMYFVFEVGILMSLVAIALSFVLAMVACRATGETDTTPVGAMGKLTQLVYGILVPKRMIPNLMAASITADAAGASADLLTGLKCGYLLGANPRKQFLAQFIGVFAGTLVVVPVFYIIVPGPEVLGTQMFPAPAAQIWASVAKLLSEGLDALSISIRWSILAGAIVGVVIPLIDRFLPKLSRFTPSAMGIGLAFTVPFAMCLSMFFGALIVLIISWKKKDWEERIVPAASGLIAGESLAGVFLLIWSTLTNG